MKATDFRPEHFEKGQQFDRNVFYEYIQANDKLSKSVFTRYLPCVAGGLLLSQVFSQGVGGFYGNIIALVCIFTGLIAGALSSMPISRRVKELAGRLGVTRADVSLARKHVKNGTVAWNQSDA